MDLRLGRELTVGHKVHLNAFAEAFNLFNADNIARVETRAFLLGTPATIGDSTATGPTPLIFQDAAEIATEGLTTAVPFGTPDRVGATGAVLSLSCDAAAAGCIQQPS